MDKPRYLNTTAAAQYMGVSRATFWRWNQHEPLPSVVIMGKVLYDTHDLDMYASNHKVGV
ncbi:MAG: hypothetical protein ACTIAG_04535 [Lactobacillus sp.]